MGVNMDYLNEDSTHAAGGADAYPAAADSNPWGAGGAPSGPVEGVGAPSNTEGGWYDTRDDMVGGTDTPYNLAGGVQQSGANWYSAGDSAPTWTSTSGLDGTRCHFGNTLPQTSLAGSEDVDQFGSV